MQNQHSSSYLVSNVQMLPSLVPEWWEPGGHGNILGLKEESESSPCESALLASASTDFQLCHFLEKHLLKKEMKLIKKISDFLTNLCPRPVRRTAWGSVSSKEWWWGPGVCGLWPYRATWVSLIPASHPAQHHLLKPHAKQMEAGGVFETSMKDLLPVSF